MKRSRSKAGRPLGARARGPTAATRVAALAGVLATTGVVAGTASASGGQAPGQQAGPVQLAYTCRSESGSARVAAQVSAGFPAAGRVGKPIQPGATQVSLTVPRAAISAVASLHPATVTGSARLAIGIAAGGVSAETVWPRLAVPATPLPARGNLTLKASGAAPSITVLAPGEVTVTAAGLVLVIVPHAAPGSISPGPNSPAPASPAPASPGPASPSPAATPGSPITPAGVRLACSLTPGQNATLATVLVTGQPSGRAAPHAAATSPCPPQPKGGLKLNPRFPPPKPPKGSKVTFPTPGSACAYVAGYSDVRKLKGSALVGPGLTDLNLTVRLVVKLTNPTYFEFDNAGILDFKPCPTCKVVHGLPPAHATFLGFGFVPVSATLQLTEVGTTNIFTIGTASALTTNLVDSVVSLRVFDVKVNGVPLNVGPHCQSAHPIVLKLVGSPHSIPPYSVQGGGPLTGEITIPPFSGCGVGENLDPLFTASISGPRNFVLLTQGVPCFVIGNQGCPPQPPKPIRKVIG